MDKKTLQTVLLFALLIFGGLFAYRTFFPTANAAAPGAPPPSANLLTLPPDIQPYAPQDAWAAPDFRMLGEAKPASAGGTYKLGLKISNINAGIEWVKLSEYAEEVGPPKSGESFSDRMTIMTASDIAARGFATLKMSVVVQSLKDPFVVGLTRPNEKVPFTWQFVEPQHPNEVRLRAYFGPKENPICEIFKVFRIVDPAGYEVDISHEIINHDEKAISVTIDQAGPVNLVRDSVQSDLRLFQSAAFSKDTINGDFKNIGQLTFTKDKLAPQDLGSFSATTDPLVWTAESNRFFTIVTRPIPTPLDMGKMLPLSKTAGAGNDIPQLAALGNASAEIVVPDKSPDWQTHLDKWVMGETLHGTTISVRPNTKPEALTTFRVYMGPQDRDLLKGDLHAAPGSMQHSFGLYKYIEVINFKRAGCAFCVFQPLAIGILGLLDVIHHYITFGNYGLAIILLVVVVRLCLHPLTRYSQVSMAKMQSKMKKVQPQLDQIKKRYAKDKAKVTAETMKLYKENNVNPAGQVLGCLPMMLQMPIWAALYSGLAVDIDLRHAGFIPGWINDLSNPDTLIRFAQPVNVPVLSWLTRGPINGINLLPILLAVVFFVQQRMQQKTMPKPSDETQAQTQMISQYMILLFPLFLYVAPSGLNLYIFASTAGGIFDTWLVRRHLRATGILPPAGAPA